MMKRKVVLVLVAMVLVLGACTAGENLSVGVVAVDRDLAGFWFGLWHGVIAPITFFISLFTDGINVYEVHNSGNWYDFGFVLGAGILFGGGRKGRKKSKK